VQDRPEDTVSRPEAAGDLSDAALLEINRLWTIVRAFSNTAHDVNNALMVIAGSAELLEARELEPAVRKRVETLRVEAARAAASVDRLQTYARAAAGAVQAVDLWPLVESAAAMRAASAGRHRIVLTVARGEAGAPRARADATRVLQALLDLLLAAEEAVSLRRGARISVSVLSEGGMVAVRVEASSEEGAGAAPPGPAAELTSGAQLWSAAAIAVQLGGRVRVVSEAIGSTMSLLLPAVDPS
jgi:signal transduction histidine kinase